MLLALLLLGTPNAAPIGTQLGAPNAFYVNQRAPLAPSPFQKLPVGAVLPEGWLKKQLQLQAAGFSGRLEEISEFLKKDSNAWFDPQGGKSDGWEEVPYWLRGQISLGYLLRDPKIETDAERWIEGVLRSRKPDGWFGPLSNLNYQDGMPDLWPNMVMLYALQTYYERSGDKHVTDLMTAYFKWENGLPDESSSIPRPTGSTSGEPTTLPACSGCTTSPVNPSYWIWRAASTNTPQTGNRACPTATA
jgi:hypothetical protein